MKVQVRQEGSYKVVYEFATKREAMRAYKVAKWDDLCEELRKDSKFTYIPAWDK